MQIVKNANFLCFLSYQTYEETLNVDTREGRGTMPSSIIKDYHLSELQFLHRCMFIIGDLHHRDHVDLQRLPATSATHWHQIWKHGH